MKEFLEKEFEKAVKLKNDFRITEKKPWSALQVANELVVQLGHYASILNNSNYSKEKGRNIANREDEISDILLQLCAICAKLNVNKTEIKFHNFKYVSEEDSVLNLMILTGQLTETIMEEEGYRHKKERKGFMNRREFITDRISKIFSIIFCNKESMYYIRAFETMRKDAEIFLKEYKKRGDKNVELSNN